MILKSIFLLMIQKGVYPYDYMDNFSKLNDRQLPTIDKFYSKLDKKECSKEKVVYDREDEFMIDPQDLSGYLFKVKVLIGLDCIVNSDH